MSDPRMVRITVKRAGERDCAGRSVSPTQATDGEFVCVAKPHTQRNSVSEIGLHGEPLSSARCFFLFYHDRCFVDVRRTSVRISLHGIARQEARRLAMWCDRSTMWRSLDLSVVASNTLCASYT